MSRIDIPGDFLARLFAVLEPGATVVVTDEPLTSANSGARLDVINADPQGGR